MDPSKNLNEDLLNEIVSRLDSHYDYVRLRCVSKFWRVFLPKRPTNLPCGLPSLMIPSWKNKDAQPCDFFSAFIGENGETYKIEVPEAAPGGMLCKGSSRGWLITVENSPFIRLINPLTNSRLQLPPMNTFPHVINYYPENTGQEYLVRMRADFQEYENYIVSLEKMKHVSISKIVLSCSPSKGKNCLAMAIYGDCHKLACCRLGDEGWKSVYDVDGGCSLFDDIIHYDGQFYAVDYKGRIIVVRDEEVDAASPKAILLAEPPPTCLHFAQDRAYLVELSGELLIISREIDLKEERYDKTVKLRVFKFNEKLESGSRWSAVGSLGNSVLFLGNNESFSFSSCDLPSSCKGNCIYFTDDNGDSRHLTAGSDLGVFYLKDRSIRELTLPLSECNSSKRRIWPPPIWIRPNPI